MPGVRDRNKHPGCVAPEPGDRHSASPVRQRQVGYDDELELGVLVDVVLGVLSAAAFHVAIHIDSYLDVLKIETVRQREPSFGRELDTLG